MTCFLWVFAPVSGGTTNKNRIDHCQRVGSISRRQKNKTSECTCQIPQRRSWHQQANHTMHARMIGQYSDNCFGLRKRHNLPKGTVSTYLTLFPYKKKRKRMQEFYAPIYTNAKTSIREKGSIRIPTSYFHRATSTLQAQCNLPFGCVFYLVKALAKLCLWVTRQKENV